MHPGCDSEGVIRSRAGGKEIILHEMLHAQDADSLDRMGKKAEGAFYVWTAEEVDEVLGADTERGEAFKRHYYVKPNGNIDLSPRRWGDTLLP